MSEATPGETDRAGSAGIAPEFLEALVCPQGRAPLRLEGDRLICTRCGPAFRIHDGIPELVIESAELPEKIERIEDLDCVREDGTSGRPSG